MAREFEWVQSLQRYRVTKGSGKGQFISSEAVNSLTLDYIEQGKKKLGDITEKLIDKSISLASWEVDFADQLKEGWVNSYAIGIGGHKNFNDDDKAALKTHLNSELQYLRGFTEAIMLQNQSEAQIRARAKQYTNGFYTAYSEARDRGHDNAGFTWQKDTLESGADHCRQCVAIADMGWVPRGSVARIGNRICKHSDRCTREYAKGTERPENSLIINRIGFIGTPTYSNRLSA